MNNDPIDEIERQIAERLPSGAGAGLRSAVMADVHRELGASRWDRRMARVAASLLIAGLVLNVAVNRRLPDSSDSGRLAAARSNAAGTLVDRAVIVAEATDPVTGQRFARQLAAITGRALTRDEAAAIGSTVQKKSSRPETNNSKG
jgi:hypothetical protein